MKLKGFWLITLSFCVFSLIIPTSQALEYSSGIKVGDVFTWEITESDSPDLIGLTMKIEILEIENMTTNWRIKYRLKDWQDLYYDSRTYSPFVSKDGDILIYLFCLVPVEQYLQMYVSSWGSGKNCYSVGNTFGLTNTQQEYTYDTNTGILLLYSQTGLGGFTYVLQGQPGQSGSIPGYNLTMIMGLLGAAIVVIVIIIKNKTRPRH